MAVWFRHGSFAVGVDDGLIRANEFARFTSLLTAARSVARERDRLVAEGEAEIATLRARAEAEASAKLSAAEQARQSGYSEGLERGLAEAAERWAERALKVAWSRRRDLERQTERLSEIVAMAIDRIIDEADRSALYMRALRTVTRLMKDVPLLTLRVPDAERDSAQAAVDEVVSALEPQPRIEVLADPALAEGACLFETEMGIIDASLQVQLAAIKRAVARAAQLVAAEAAAAADAPASPPAPLTDPDVGPEGLDAEVLTAEVADAEAAEDLALQYDGPGGES